MQTSPFRFAAALVVSAALIACKTARPMNADQRHTATPAVPAPDAAKFLTSGVDFFQTTCREDLASARKQLEALPQPGPELLEAFDEVQAKLFSVSARASVARNAHPDEAMRNAADVCEQEAEKLATELGLDRRLYDALAAVDLNAQDATTRHWIEKTLREMRRAGVDRDEPTRQKVKALNEELTVIGQEFGKNIREDVRFIEVPAKALDGLPEDYRRAHPPNDRGLVKITTDTPDYVPFMTYAKDAKAREQLWRVYRLRGHPKNAATLNKLISKRHELATLLGYPSWAAYVTETKMIKTAEKASEFIDTVNRAAEKAAQQEHAQLLALKRRDEPKAKELHPWDQDFYEDRYKAEKFGFDSQKARPYFEYARVLDGVLQVTSKMFQIRYEKVASAKTWHEDVVTYDILDASGGGLLGRIHLDMHPRANKYKHAAQFDLATGQKGKRHPEGVLMCNFPKPGAEPALMQPREVETFFHEFGHLLHHIFAGRQQWAAQSGIRTEWDFVEAPSMLLQEWAQNADALALFAKHYQTSAPIPPELVSQMVAAKEFGKGLFTRRQMFLSAVSLNYYNRAPGFDTTALGKQLQKKFEPFRREFVDGTHFQLAFGHLDGYSAIYYTYIWSSVIARDLMTVFEKDGFLSPAPAGKYRQAILEAGGSADAADLVQRFLGRDFSFNAYEAWLNKQPAL